jgi:hypothetical protein
MSLGSECGAIDNVAMTTARQRDTFSFFVTLAMAPVWVDIWQ